MHELARKRQGECLSKTYINNHTKLQWKCAAGHTWWAMPGKIQQGRWCPECKRLHSGDSQRLSIRHMYKLARKRRGKCLSQIYKNASTKLEWKCREGHTWWAVPNSIQQGSWCPTVPTAENISVDSERRQNPHPSPGRSPGEMRVRQGRVHNLRSLGTKRDYATVLIRTP
jgi:hypothetical protein